MAFLAFSGAEALGLGALAGGAVIAHNSAPIDLNYHGWTDYGSTPFHAPPPHANTGEIGIYHPPIDPKHPDQPADHDISDPYARNFHQSGPAKINVPPKIVVDKPVNKPPPASISPYPGFKPTLPPIKTSFQVIGNSKGFGAGIETQMPLKAGNQEIIPSAYVLGGGPYGHPQVIGGGINVTVPIK